MSERSSSPARGAALAGAASRSPNATVPSDVAAGPDTAEPRGTGGVGHRRSGGLVEGQRRGAGIREEVIQFPRAAPPVERHHDNAGKLAGPVERRHLPAVLHDDGEPVSPPKFERAQAAGDA